MNNLIIDSLNYYNNLKLLKIIDFEIIEDTTTYNLLPIMKIMTIDKKIEKAFNIIGIYNIEYNIFYWAWYLNIKYNRQLYSINLLFNCLHLNNNKEVFNLENFFKKKIISTPFFKIKDDIYLNLIVAIGCYLTNVDYIYKHVSNNIIIFIGIYNISNK